MYLPVTLFDPPRKLFSPREEGSPLSRWIAASPAIRTALAMITRVRCERYGCDRPRRCDDERHDACSSTPSNATPVRCDQAAAMCWRVARRRTTALLRAVEREPRSKNAQPCRRTITPRTCSAADPEASWCVRKVRQCGLHAILGRASRSAATQSDEAADFKNMTPRRSR